MKKQRKHKNGNAESKEAETALGTDSNLGSRTNVSLDSKLEQGENSSRKADYSETEQLTHSRKRRKKKGNSLIDEKPSELVLETKVHVSFESGLKEDVNTLVNDTVLGKECSGSESRVKEQPLDSERKSTKKKKKKHKRDSSGKIEEEGPESVVELRAEKENSVIDGKQSDCIVESKGDVSLESGLKEDVNSLVNDVPLLRESFGLESQLDEQLVHSERKSKKKKKHKKGYSGQFKEEGLESAVEPTAEKENSVIDEKQNHCGGEAKVNVSLKLEEKVSLESELKGSQLNEQLADSEWEKKKRKRKRECKMAKAEELEKLNPKSEVELIDRNGNSFIDEKQRDCYVESKLNVSLESGLMEGASKDSLLEKDSRVEELENFSLGSGLRGNKLHEQPADEDKRKKRKRKHKMAKAKQFENLDAKSIRDVEENSLIDEKQIDSHVESKLNVSSLESGQKEGANSDAEALENIVDCRLNGTQSNDQIIQPERKRERKREREKEKQEKRRLSVMQDNDLSSKTNDMCPEHQITNTKDFKKEDLMSISENVESENTKKRSMIPDKQIDCSQDASTSMVKTQDLHVDGDLVVPEVKDDKTFEIGSILKTYQRQRKKSSNIFGGSLEPVQENHMIQTSIDHLEKEHTTGFSENRPDAVLVGEHAMPEQIIKEALGISADSKPKGRKRKRRRKKLEESLCKDPEPKDVKMENKIEELIPSPLNLCCPKKKLLVLDLNGILVDVIQNPGEFKPDIKVSGKAVFKRPFCDDFLEFCFRTFNVGIWSSRINKNVGRLVGFLMRKWRHNLLFCWDRKQCTMTKFKTIEDKQKPLVLKELRKLWEKHRRNLPWQKGEYDESNTLLLDDSPYKALRNPPNTAVFPYPYQHTDGEDSSLGHGGDIRTYLEGLAAADNVQKYVERNPFGQPAITESDPYWDFYCQIINQ